MKIERTQIHFFSDVSLPSPSSDLKVPIRVVTHCCVMSPIGGMGSLSNDNVWKT